MRVTLLMSKKTDNKVSNLRGNKFMKKLTTNLFTLSIATTLIMTGCANSTKTSSADSSEKDTTAPVITIDKESVDINTGDKYDASKNIKSVKDDVDGKVEKADKEVKDKAYYIIDSSAVDTGKAGTYKVTVKACDTAGNKSKKDFSVNVKDKDSETSKSDTASKETAKADTKSNSGKSKSETSKKAESKPSTSSSKKSTDTSTKKTQPSKNSGTASNNSGSSSSSKPSTSGSSASAQTQSTPKHEHSWVYVAPVTHTETKTVVDQAAWDETVVDQAAWTETVDWIVCNGCGYKTQSRDAFMDHAAFSEVNPACGSYHVDTEYIDHPAVTHSVHHDAVTHTESYEVTDKPGYNKCSTCGATK